MNKRAHAFKLAYFKKFVIGTRQDVYPQMSKKKKKATSALANLYQHLNLRFHFSKFAILTDRFRSLRHLKTRKMAAVNCLFRRYRVTRSRLAFLRLKKNLNVALRESMVSSQERDKDLFIQLNQILLTSHRQQGGLEGGFQYGLGEIFSYLRE